MDYTINSDDDLLNQTQAADRQTAELLLRGELIRKEYGDYVKQKNIWSNNLLILLWFIFGANLVFILLTGFGVLHFTDPWIGRIVFSGNFADILGLIGIIVAYLFPKKGLNLEEKNELQKSD